MRKPSRLRDVQKFTGYLASVSQLLSWLGERALPLYQLMKKTTPFEWNNQADKAFRDLKRMLSTTTVLAAPAEEEPLLLYVAATLRPVSMVMVVERPEEGKKLKQYFQEHVVTVVSTAHLGEIIGCRDASGRVAKWALELAGHTILYEPRTTIKSQALADFLVDWTETHLRAGIVLSSPKGDWLQYALEIHFTASNNVAEYEALVHGLRLAKELSIRCIVCYGDSDLVVQQCSGEWDARDPNMASYRFLVQKLSGFFAGCEFLHVPRAENEAANTLAKIAS
ncbi:uncharacterized protein [Aegilops tauschii subsp. strangulata]|uniref:uncharacterized protein n=1 Tax=Aegilops tauschii subsp. strangulata TaxID=200361 RepID=UPI003CC84122